MASRVILEFNDIPVSLTAINITDTGLNRGMYEVFNETRDQAGVSIKGINTNQTAFNFANAFGLDWNNTSIYDISVLGNTVIITALNPLSSFTVVDSTGVIDVTINNEEAPVVFNIENVVVSEADINPCDNIKLTVTTNETADRITSPIVQDISTNPFIIEVPRQDLVILIALKDTIFSVEYIRAPKLLGSLFNISILNSPSLASITVSNNYVSTPIFALEYSLDGVNWQKSTYFNNLIEGDYTLYIKDDLGCEITKTFSIDSFVANVIDYDAICEVSNLNSIRYKENVIWGTKTPYNTLSFEEDIKLPNNSFTQLFNRTDTIRTQIKTNYSDVTAKIIDDNGNETNLIVSKMTANMGVNDVRDAEILSTTFNGFNYVSVKYSGGKTFDPDTLEETGDYYFGGSVPNWCNADDYVYVQGAGWYKILDIVYSVDSYVLILNLLVSDFPLLLGTFKVTTVYNVVDYENYEFACNFALLEGFYKVQIDISDSEFGTKSYLSEWLNIKFSHQKTLLIEYYNTVNNEINYNTGITHKLRLPFADTLRWKPSTEQDIYVTDTNTVSLESKYRGFWDLVLKPLPTMMAEKVTLALLQDRLFINTVNYLKEGDVDSVNVGGQYQIKAGLVKSNYVFDSNSGLGIGNVTLEGTPLAINPDGGFLLVE